MDIAIVGSGVVGRATGFGFELKGHNVLFSDTNDTVLDRLRATGHAVCPPKLLAEQRGIEAFFLPVSTPTVDGKIQLHFLKSAVQNLGAGYLRKTDDYCTVVIRSTVPPGTTEGELIPLLEQGSTKKAGVHFGVAHNPEYLRENRNEQDFQDPWIVLIGEMDEQAGENVERAYGEQKCPVVHSSIRGAEMQKYVHNLYNATKISFFNEMRAVCERVGVSPEEIFPLVAKSAEACWNPQYGIRNFGAFAGSCLPKDTAAFLEWAKRELHHELPLLEAVIEVNEAVKERDQRQVVAA